MGSPSTAGNKRPRHHKQIHIKLPSDHEKRWKEIDEAYQMNIRSVQDLPSLFQKTSGRAKMNVCNLVNWIQTLPRLLRLARGLPRLCPVGTLPLLQHTHQRLSLKQDQVACILVNAFFCTLSFHPWDDQPELPDVPEVWNVQYLLQAKGRVIEEKLKCIVHYLDEVSSRIEEEEEKVSPTTRVISFIRLGARPPNVTEEDSPLLTLVQVFATGAIEDHQEAIQIDFANAYIGGGVLHRGCVQEEIRFMINPELLVCRLFTPVLQDHEALLMVGAEQFSSYRGYAQSFRFDGPYQDPTPIRDEHTQTYIVAIDATNYRGNEQEQYCATSIQRELTKATIGFQCLDSGFHLPHIIASGNWGCGVFRGNVILKFLLQWIAASRAKRVLHYHTFHDTELRSELQDLVQEIQGCSPSRLTQYLMQLKTARLNVHDLVAQLTKT